MVPIEASLARRGLLVQQEPQALQQHGRQRGRGRNGGRRPVEANWRGRRHRGRKGLERGRCRRGLRSWSVLGASLGAECANHGHCKQTNSGERFHGQTLPSHIDERKADRSAPEGSLHNFASYGCQSQSSIPMLPMGRPSGGSMGGWRSDALGIFLKQLDLFGGEKNVRLIGNDLAARSRCIEPAL